MPVYATLITANQINTGQMTGTSSLAVSASYSETASFAINSVNTGSFIVTASIYKQEISGDLGTTNFSATGSGSFDSVTVGTPSNGMFRLRTSGSGIDDMALTVEFFSGSWIECGYFKK